MKLALAMIFAKDVERMTTFYRDGLGLRPVPGESSPGWVVFDAGGARFALHAIPPDIAAGIHIEAPPEERSDTAIKLTFATDALDAICARLPGLGGSLRPPRGSGARDVVDPEGNIIQLQRA
jgi:catechol 2,3-dioxygenase-like lactoylglutathione lyase family enzyme